MRVKKQNKIRAGLFLVFFHLSLLTGSAGGDGEREVNTIEGEGKLFIEEVRKLLSEKGNLAVDRRSNTIMVTDTRKRIKIIRKFIEETDRPVEQVRINTKIVEVTLNKGYELGVKWEWGRKKQGSRWEEDVEGGDEIGRRGKIDIIPDFMGRGLEWEVLKGADVNLLLRALSTKLKVNLLSSPEISTLSNKPAQIKVGTEFPVKRTTTRRTYAEGIPEDKTEVWYEKVSAGIILWVRPQVMEGRLIKMKIRPEVSEITAMQEEYPIRDLQDTETTVVVKDGETLVMSGLVTEKKKKDMEGVPLLKDIPLLGYLFRHTTETETKKELLIFLTPHIIDYHQEEENDGPR